jgi:alanyl-tRNA synthetase
VDKGKRAATARNHTATHLLHTALRAVIGEHVKQAGSYVSHDRLRFDFSHFYQMDRKELDAVEDFVNEKILENGKVGTETKDIKDALQSGVIALFGEKYGETVRVVRVPGVSAELCGGTHCDYTGQIGLFVVVSEGSVASGVRRIEALTGKSAFDYLRGKKAELDEIKVVLKTDKPLEKIEKLIGDTKLMEKRIQNLKTGSSGDAISDALKEALEFDGLRVVRLRKDGLNSNELRILADNIRDHVNSGIIVASSVTDDSAAIVCMVTKDLTSRYHAGEIMKSLAGIAGGKGGGKPEMAQGGIKDIEKLDTALKALPDIIKDHAKG